MKKQILYLFVIVILANCTTPATTTSSATKVAPPTRIAVLPAQVMFGGRPRGAAHFDEQQMETLSRYTSLAMQTLLYEELNKYCQTKSCKTQLQDYETTNTQLSNEKMSFATLFASNKKDICSLLGVDAVMNTQVRLVEAPAESMREAANHFWSVQMRVAVFNNEQQPPIWTFSDNKASSNRKQAFQMPFAMPKDYAAILQQFVPQLERLVKSFVKSYPYKD
jgi:hypothetical protein